MRVIVCIKPVKADLVYADERRNEKFVINPYDIKALMVAVNLKKQRDCHVTCICMGSQASGEALIKALAMGADQAVLMSDPVFGGADTVATTYVLARGIESLGGGDLIFCGEKSIDGETGQVAFGLSERLAYPCISNVDEILDITENQITFKQTTDEYEQVVRVPSPVMVVSREFMVETGKISLSALKKAKKTGFIVWTAADLNLELEKCGIGGSKTRVLEIHNDMVKKESRQVQGDAAGKAELIMKLLAGLKTEGAAAG
ncbi:MAG: electron transfer flavoprotein subunit beta/FixA family protein [Hungatella sp.]|jgi:electron transfer flavoprotein beta subunit|nr:electron transfer flavoprotein subunit beta/FixA family protein [Hungatella sp.]